VVSDGRRRADPPLRGAFSEGGTTSRCESGVGLQSSGLVPPQWRPERLAGQEAEEGLRLEGEEALEQLDGEELRALKVI